MIITEKYYITNEIEKELLSRIHKLYLSFDRQENYYNKPWKRTLNFYVDEEFEFEFTLEIYFNCIKDNQNYNFWVKKSNITESIIDSKVQICTFENKEKSLLHNLFKAISKEFNDFNQNREKTIRFMDTNNKMIECKIYMDNKMITQVWNTYKDKKNNNSYFTQKTSKIGA